MWLSDSHVCKSVQGVDNARVEAKPAMLLLLTVM
jgi:hypothetical protein